MSDWNNDSSWSGMCLSLSLTDFIPQRTLLICALGGGAAAATSSSWDAGVPLSSDWDAGTKGPNVNDTKFDAFSDGNAEGNGDHGNSMDNAGGGGDDRACRM